MRTITPCVLLILSCLCIALTQMYFEDCCLKYMKKLSHRTQKHIVQHREQRPDGGCNLHAVVFTTRRGRKFCADPREDWVTDLRRRIEEREARRGKAKTSSRYHRHVNRD